MRIQILGPGCRKCRTLAERAEAAASQLGLACELEKVTDLAEIARSGVMLTPALVVDGKVKTSGTVPTLEEITALLAGEQSHG